MSLLFVSVICRKFVVLNSCIFTFSRYELTPEVDRASFSCSCLFRVFRVFRGWLSFHSGSIRDYLFKTTTKHTKKTRTRRRAVPRIRVHEKGQAGKPVLHHLNMPGQAEHVEE